jgi:Fe2+ or Zn2+ uptake regulation protein
MNATRSVTSADFQALLRQKNLRVTRPRLAVLKAVHENPHVGTYALIEASRRDLRVISHQTVYDVLEALTAAGLIRRFQPMGALARYEARTADDHQHVVCRACASIADVNRGGGVPSCPSLADGAGYEIDEAEVIYWGRCPACVALDRQGVRDNPQRLQKGDTR